MRAIKPAEIPSAAGGRGSGDSDSRLRTLRLVALALVAVAVVAAWRTGLLSELGEPSRVAGEVVALGAWGAVAFLVAYTVLQPFGVPGMVFVVAASLIWPWPTAFALSLAGTMAASVVGFLFARLVARDWVSGLVPARFRAYDEALARRGFATVFRSAPVLDAAGAPRLLRRLARRLLDALLGVLRRVPRSPLRVELLRAHLFEMLRVISLQGWLVIGATAVLIVTAAYVVRRRSAMST